MKWAYLPQFGHASCPHCRQDFDLAAAEPTFLEKAPHNDTVVYVMCPDCHGAYQSATEPERKGMCNTCFRNFKTHGTTSDGGLVPFAITTTLTLALNDWCLTAAIENGHGLSRNEYFEICSKKCEVAVLPSGLRIISSRGGVQ
jgi:hypothetical protein